jgi:hypothetical protein
LPKGIVLFFGIFIHAGHDASKEHEHYKHKEGSERHNVDEKVVARQSGKYKEVKSDEHKHR